VTRWLTDGVEQIIARGRELVRGSKVVRRECCLRCGERCACFRHRTVPDIVVWLSSREMLGHVREMTWDCDSGVGRKRSRRSRLRYCSTPERERQEHRDE